MKANGEKTIIDAFLKIENDGICLFSDMLKIANIERHKALGFYGNLCKKNVFAFNQKGVMIRGTNFNNYIKKQMNTISNRIKSLRTAKKLSQKELAKLANVSQPTVYNLEHGKTDTVTLVVAKKISEVLEIPFAELFEIEQHKQGHLTYGDALEMIGALRYEYEKSMDSDFKHQIRINMLETREKNLIEFVLWIKEAFGHCVNEDYFNYTLGEHIDFSLKEFDIYIPTPKASGSKPAAKS